MQTNQHQTDTPSHQETRPKFTCISCGVQFKIASLQREHYQTDWHRYNLKRKVVNLLPLTAEEFSNRLLQAQKQKERVEDDEREILSGAMRCDVCGKNFASKQTMENHLASKKHKEKLEKKQKEDSEEYTVVENDNDDAVWEDAGGEVLFQLQQDVKNSKMYRDRLRNAQTEEEMENILKDKIKTSIKLNPNKNCLFCPHESTSLEDNLTHMTNSHSFFIPDFEYLVDLNGLLEYLGEKISVRNICIYCNGKGRTLDCLDAVWKHMENKGHQKIAFESEEDELEISDFYDFSSTWNDEEDHDLVPRNSTAIESEDSSELILPSGTKIGHRSLQRYYKQHLRLRDEKESVILSRLADQYRAMIAIEEPRWRDRKERFANRQRQSRQTKDSMQIGMKGNLQKHYRAQIDF